LKRTAYAIVEGIAARTYHLRFTDLNITDDAKPGAIVETGAFEDSFCRNRLFLAAI
jgi:hypothetical protein